MQNTITENCPMCGKALAHVTQILAGTEAGAQCHNCWTHLRRKEGRIGNRKNTKRIWTEARAAAA